MCGIAGFSFGTTTDLDRTAIARVLLAGLAERGRDATGYGYRVGAGPIEVVKDSVPLREIIDEVDLPAGTTEAILHVREFTKGVPKVNDNNHPVRWGRVVGVHNGHLDNDDDLFAQYGMARSTPHIQVDSEAIMMLTDVLGDLGRALEEVRGSAAVAQLVDDRPGRLTLARRTRRPLVVGRGDGALLFASTRDALELVAAGAGLELEYEDLPDGTVLEIEAGREIARRRFRVDYRYPGRKLRPYPRLPEKERLVRFALACLVSG